MQPNTYYEYYATQVMHHMGGDYWDFWNKGDGKGTFKGMRDILIKRQDADGSLEPGRRRPRRRRRPHHDHLTVAVDPRSLLPPPAPLPAGQRHQEVIPLTSKRPSPSRRPSKEGRRLFLFLG